MLWGIFFFFFFFTGLWSNCPCSEFCTWYIRFNQVFAFVGSGVLVLMQGELIFFFFFFSSNFAGLNSGVGCFVVSCSEPLFQSTKITSTGKNPIIVAVRESSFNEGGEWVRQVGGQWYKVRRKGFLYLFIYLLT